MLSPNKKVTEWEITKTADGNKMEIFITLTKYNTRLWREDTHCQWWQISQQNYPPPSSDQCIYEEWNIPIIVHKLGI